MTLTEATSARAAAGRESANRVLPIPAPNNPFFGVKVADLKVLHKKLNGDQSLVLTLSATGNGDGDA